jgi:hypothetical protein
MVLQIQMCITPGHIQIIITQVLRIELFQEGLSPKHEIQRPTQTRTQIQILKLLQAKSFLQLILQYANYLTIQF